MSRVRISFPAPKLSDTISLSQQAFLFHKVTGRIAKRLCRGLQSLIDQFDSGSGLHFLESNSLGFFQNLNLALLILNCRKIYLIPINVLKSTEFKGEFRMDVISALEQRKSTRAFLNKPVTKEQVTALLSAARCAPSGVNTQPWSVVVLTGKSKENLQAKIEAAFRSGDKGKRDYQYYPIEWKDPYKSRRKECGLLMYSTLGISREDKESQINQWAANYRAFDAPVLLLFYMDSEMQSGSFMDCGMFLQSVMLGALDLGLSTCPQAAFADYQHIIKTELDYGHDKILLCGMALGYEDTEAAINNYRTSREKVGSFTTYFE